MQLRQNTILSTFKCLFLMLIVRRYDSVKQITHFLSALCVPFVKHDYIIDVYYSIDVCASLMSCSFLCHCIELSCCKTNMPLLFFLLYFMPLKVKRNDIFITIHIKIMRRIIIRAISWSGCLFIM